MQGSGMSMDRRKKDWVGIASLGVYLPSAIETSADIARKAGLTVETVEQKLGVLKKHIASPDEHVSHMAVQAARRALGQFDPVEVDAVIYFGSEYKDYPVWSCACKIQHEIGAVRAFATEIMSLCTSFTMALKFAKALMQTDRAINNVLLVGATKESSLIDYANPRVRFMYDFGDGAAAALLQKGLQHNIILESHHITMGQFSEHIRGVVSATGECRIDLLDGHAMKESLDPVSIGNFIKVVETALEKSGKNLSDLDFLAPIHVKRSVHRELLQRLGLKEEQSFYLENYGHVQAADPILALGEATERGLLHDGDLVALLGAGTGFTWGATILQWGREQPLC
ncbi:MAG: 3-oxoacyl-(acyl-carrier-protein) synthase 3 [Firmicutes bacterium]|nr:3-oxoacyl-(acyl-carrier-protein) synthase 3 [Bacillota bacterium]